jgi:phosphatidylserine/phosphatidylglycerophosphate/cardiolipin synthase-like enzyme
VTVILVKSQRIEYYSGTTYLFDHKIPTYIDAKHAFAHDTMIIVDGYTVLTGSFNFTTRLRNPTPRTCW